MVNRSHIEGHRRIDDDAPPAAAQPQPEVELLEFEEQAVVETPTSRIAPARYNGS